MEGAVSHCQGTKFPIVCLLCKGKWASGSLLCQDFLLQLHLSEKKIISYSFCLISVDFWQAMRFIPYNVHFHTITSSRAVNLTLPWYYHRILLLIMFCHFEILNQRLEKSVSLFYNLHISLMELSSLTIFRTSDDLGYSRYLLQHPV